MESTGDAVFGLPLFVASICAKWTGDCFGRGIYDMHIVELKNIPFLEYVPEREMITMSVRGVMSKDVVAVEQVETVMRITEVLTTCAHNGFPVLYPSTWQLAGTIERTAMESILR